MFGGYCAYRPAVTNRPSNYSPGIAFGSDLQREDLGGVQPWDSKPGSTEPYGEDKGEGGSCGAVLRCVRFVVDGKS